MPYLPFSLILGFILGIKHAFEADHVLAVSTIVSKHHHLLKAALIGIFWGLGHTTTLFIIGILVLVFKLSIPEELTFSFELLVGLMLIILGVRVFLRQEDHSKSLRKHHTSFLVGLLHGLAGSGTLMLLVLSTISTLMEGLFYIFLFGLGSVMGMTVMSSLLIIPFLYSANKFPKIEKYLQATAGVFSILFGLFVIYHILQAQAFLGHVLQTIWNYPP